MKQMQCIKQMLFSTIAEVDDALIAAWPQGLLKVDVDKMDAI